MSKMYLPDYLNVPKIEEWQLNRLVDNLLGMNYQKNFAGFYMDAFIFRPDGVDNVNLYGLRFKGSRTLSARDIQWYKDVIFVRPHTALQIGLEGKVMVVGFWSDNLDALKKWIKEQLPNVDTSASAEGVFRREVQVE